MTNPKDFLKEVDSQQNLCSYGATDNGGFILHNDHLKHRHKCDEKHSIGSDDFKLAVEIEMQECESLDEVANGSETTDNTGSDPWALTELADTSEKWSEMDTKGKIKRVLSGIAKMAALLFLLFFFVCSLDLLSSSFRLVGGRTTGQIFQQSDLLQNPVVGVMIGILTTVLVQSSSTSSSIIVSMVSANFLTVRVAIPIIMGANIGTSVTNTIVSLTQMGDRNEFRRAFAAATVHDMFNWLSVIVLFPLEILTREVFGQGYLEASSDAVTKHIGSNSSGGGEVKLLNAITEPVTKLIIQIDKGVLEGWSKNDSRYFNASLIKQNCSYTINDTKIMHECPFLMRNTGLNDMEVGLILLAISLFVLCGCLVCIVKVLNSMLKGQIANVIKRVINANIPYVPWATGYLAISIGAIMTFLVQSSSVFTSALTPLVGVGVISVERVYPLTLGSNIGTTTTSVIAAMAAPPEQLRYTLQIALCHFFFNVTGILLFYPVPFTRFPVPMSKCLGDTTAKYRWFAIAYLILMFFFVPGIVLGLSLAGSLALFVVLGPTAVLAVLVMIVTVMQRKIPSALPEILRTWNWLPLWMRSLEPLDNVILRVADFASICKCKKEATLNTVASASGISNKGFE